MSVRVVGVGASAGGVEALTRLARALPADFPGAILVVLHLPPFSASALPTILDRAGPLAARHPEDGDAIEAGRIYVAPPDYHLLALGQTMRVVRGPRENNNRPAIDPLFRSIAFTAGPRGIAVVLSGALDDGAAGAAAVTAAGGTVLVQDPEEALYPSMPTSAIAADSPSRVLPVEEIAATLDRLVREPGDDPNGGRRKGDNDLALEQSFAAFELSAIESGDNPGEPAGLGCPACGGALWEAPDELMRFRCRVGHAYSVESLVVAQQERVDEALWVALRALEERRSVALRLAKRLEERDLPSLAARQHEVAEEAAEHARALRSVLMRQPPEVVA